MPEWKAYQTLFQGVIFLAFTLCVQNRCLCQRKMSFSMFAKQLSGGYQRLMSRWKYQISRDHWNQASWAQPVFSWIHFIIQLSNKKIILLIVSRYVFQRRRKLDVLFNWNNQAEWRISCRWYPSKLNWNNQAEWRTSWRWQSLPGIT